MLFWARWFNSLSIFVIAFYRRRMYAAYRLGNIDMGHHRLPYLMEKRTEITVPTQAWVIYFPTRMGRMVWIFSFRRQRSHCLIQHQQEVVVHYPTIDNAHHAVHFHLENLEHYRRNTQAAQILRITLLLKGRYNTRSIYQPLNSIDQPLRFCSRNCLISLSCHGIIYIWWIAIHQVIY